MSYRQSRSVESEALHSSTLGGAFLPVTVATLGSRIEDFPMETGNDDSNNTTALTLSQSTSILRDLA